MQKVAILTMSGALNFGVQLQAIALREILRRNNIEADILFFKHTVKKANMLSSTIVLLIKRF